MTAQRGTIAVQTRVVMDVLVARLHERALALSAGPAPAELEATVAPEVARLGYFARVAEVESFEAAREPARLAERRVSPPAEGFASSHQDRTVSPAGNDAERLAELAAELAQGEPLERPDPGHPTSASWRIPGPGGHVRHYVALRACGAASASSDEHRLELKRAWMFGFYVRCLEEQAGYGADPPG